MQQGTFFSWQGSGLQGFFVVKSPLVAPFLQSSALATAEQAFVVESQQAIFFCGSCAQSTCCCDSPLGVRREPSQLFPVCSAPSQTSLPVWHWLSLQQATDICLQPLASQSVFLMRMVPLLHTGEPDEGTLTVGQPKESPFSLAGSQHAMTVSEQRASTCACCTGQDVTLF